VVLVVVLVCARVPCPARVAELPASASQLPALSRACCCARLAQPRRCCWPARPLTCGSHADSEVVLYGAVEAWWAHNLL